MMDILTNYLRETGLELASPAGELLQTFVRDNNGSGNNMTPPLNDKKLEGILLPVLTAMRKTEDPRFLIFTGQLIERVRTGQDYIAGMQEEFKHHARKYLRGRQPSANMRAAIDDAGVTKYEDLIDGVSSILLDIIQAAGPSHHALKSTCRAAVKALGSLIETKPPISENAKRPKRRSPKSPRNGNGHGSKS